MSEKLFDVLVDGQFVFRTTQTFLRFFLKTFIESEIIYMDRNCKIDIVEVEDTYE